MNVTILGLGVEGRAAAAYFAAHKSRSVDLTIIDSQLQDLDALAGATFIPEEQAQDILPGTELFLRSPGIPPTHPLIKKAVSLGIPVTTPTGYWLANHAPPSTITVTGTKGKSTTVHLLAQMLTALGEPAIALGNLGAPPLSAELPKNKTPVVEMSSYMMHDLPLVGQTHIVTNLYREHLDWHGTEANYAGAKLRPFLGTPTSKGLAPTNIVRSHQIHTAEPIEDAVAMNDTTLFFADHEFVPGAFNPAFRHRGLLLAFRVAIAATLQRFPAEAVAEAAKAVATNFQGLPSRQERLSTSDGRTWVNDALATVPEATIMALDCWNDGPVTMLVGGADRGQDFTQLAAALAARPDVTPIVFGSIRERVLAACLAAHVSVILVPDFDGALEKAKEISDVGDVVLFSPAAASEPPHGNYQRRAKAFAKAAAEMSPKA